MASRLLRVLTFALAIAAAVPATVLAQSAIAGQVKDATGAVLPGVTVEASSEVLIEKVRSVVTDDQGQYKIIDLRPGVYTITFTLPGFNTFKRDGIELPASFTATINAELRVGAIEETVTVTGESPIVDVQSTVHTQVLNRDVLDALPTARSIQGLGQLVIGVSLSIPDVGGSRAMQQTYMSTHGMTAANVTVLVDGMMINGLQADGAVQSYHNDLMNQEVSYQTSGIGADTQSGGVRLNMIPKEGGNRFSGSFFANWKDGAWQGDNFTQELRNRGLANPSRIDRIYDFNAGQGGPIMRDKLWFYSSARAWSTDAPIAGTFHSDGTGRAMVDCQRGGSCRQGIDDQRIKSVMTRLTWQVSPRNKFAAYFDEIDKYRGHAMTAGEDPDLTSRVWNSPAYSTGQAKWTSTVSNRLLVEGGYSRNLEYYTTEYQAGVDRLYGTPEWLASASRFDRDLVFRTTAADDTQQQSPERHNLQASASYVTGSHNVKTGVQWTWGDFFHERHANADLTQEYRSNSTGIPFTVPNAVVVRNTPYESRERLNGDVGIYAQDEWTLKRLTLTGGLRWEYVNAEVPEQFAPAGRFAPFERHAARIPNVPNWKDWAPRFGAAYDLFGNGRTALKFSLNKYNLARTTGLAEDFNTLRNQTATLAWRDLNGNDIAEGPFRCVYLSPGCEINYAQLPASFGLAATAQYDPTTERPYNLEVGAQVQHELLPRVSVTGSWYRGTFRNLNFTDNQNITLNDWRAVQVFNPITGQPMTIYDLALSPKPQVNDLHTTAPDRRQTFESYGLQFNARLLRGATLFGGLGFARELFNRCDERDNPNLLRFCDDANLDEGFGIPYRGQFKVSGSIPLPWAIQAAATFQSNPGSAAFTNTTTRTTGAAAWIISGGTNPTRYPADCPAPCPAGQVILPTVNGTPTSSNLSIRLVPFGADGENSFHDRVNQLDLRLTRTFRVANIRLLPQLDLYNLFNASSVILFRSHDFGTAAYRRPSGILNGRIVGIGMQAHW